MCSFVFSNIIFFSKFFEEILKNSYLIILHLILLFGSYCICYWIFNLQLEKYSYSRRLSKLKWKTKSVVKDKRTYFLIDFFPKNIFDFLLFTRLIRINIQKKWNKVNVEIYSSLKSLEEYFIDDKEFNSLKKQPKSKLALIGGVTLLLLYISY